MNILLIDTETEDGYRCRLDGTIVKGTDPDSQAIEVAAVLWHWETSTALATVQFLFRGISGHAIGSEFAGITPEATGEMTDALWQTQVEGLRQMAPMADYAIAHNAEFDRPRIEAVCPAIGSIPWVCSCKQIAWNKDKRKRGTLRQSPSLVELAAAYGVPIVATHNALSDVMLLAGVFAASGVIVKDLIKDALLPRTIYQAIVSYDDKDKAKALGFTWNPTAKQWQRSMTAAEAGELTGCGFRVEVVG